MRKHIGGVWFLGVAAVIVAVSEIAIAQTGLTYTIVTDGAGNVVAQLQGSGYTTTTVQGVSATIATPTPVPSAPSGWANVSWGAGALGIGVNATGATWFTAASGTIYVVGPNGASPVAGGVAVRVAVDPAGVPWCVTVGHAIFKLTNGSWQQLPGAAIDIGIGGNGKIFILATDGSLASWNGSGWTPFAGGGGGQRIAVDPSGNPWVTNASNQIFRWTGSQWQQTQGAAMDVAIGPDGTVYCLGMATGPGGNLLYRWDPSVSNWNTEGIYGSAIGAGTGLHAYIARAAGSGLATISR